MWEVPKRENLGRGSQTSTFSLQSSKPLNTKHDQENFNTESDYMVPTVIWI